MATVTSSLMTEYSGATGGWRSYLTYSTSTTDTAVTITCAGGICSDYWTFAISSGITSTLSCTGQSSASGSGGLSSSWSSDVYNQLVSKTYTITRTSSAQSITIQCSTTNSSGYINGTAVAKVTITVPALESSSVTTYTVSFDANGGDGAPANQTKTSDVTLQLSTDIPTKTDCVFIGWGTSASATSATYYAGGNYTNNSAATLYAVWAKFHPVYVNIPSGSTLSGVYYNV